MSDTWLSERVVQSSCELTLESATLDHIYSLSLTALLLFAEVRAAVTLLAGELVCKTLCPAISLATLPRALFIRSAYNRGSRRNRYTYVVVVCAASFKPFRAFRMASLGSWLPRVLLESLSLRVSERPGMSCELIYSRVRHLTLNFCSFSRSAKQVRLAMSDDWTSSTHPHRSHGGIGKR